MSKNISTLLREIKGSTGWSETYLADQLGTSQPTVNRILNGQDECKGSTLRAIEALHEKYCGPATRRATDPIPEAPNRPARHPQSASKMMSTQIEDTPVITRKKP